MKGVVITGIGLVTPLGAGREEAWTALLHGRSGLGRRDYRGRAVACGTVPGIGPPGGWERIFEFTEKASREAFAQAGWMPEGEPCACVVGFGKPPLAEGSPEAIGRIVRSYLEGGVAARIGRALRCGGPFLQVSAACATGAVAAGTAFEWIREGRCPAALAAAADAPLEDLYVAGFLNLGVLAAGSPGGRAVRPFDRARSGFGLGEGAGAILLEEEGRAVRRGARILGRVAGFRQANDPSHPVRMAPQGTAIEEVLSGLLRQAGFPARKVDYVNCHGTATPMNDRLEARALGAIFGSDGGETSFSATKASTGHLLAAAGLVEAGFAVLSLRDGAVPPTLNLEDPDCELDLTPLRARRRPVETSLSLSFGFGGSAAGLLFSRH